MKGFHLFVLTIAVICGGSLLHQGLQKKPKLVVTTPNVPVHYIGKVALNDNISIRLLILKHSYEPMADGDAKLAIQAVNLAANKGLQIKDIGNYNINRQGPRYVSKGINLPELKHFISNQMKVDAESGDTLIIFTIGHGFGGGSLDNLGQREGVMSVMAQAAAENGQETVWWQLSCHASAGLPSIDSLSEEQRSLFSIIASSKATELSSAYVQGKHMEKIFLAMAERSLEIDPDGDDEITQGELSDFMNKHIHLGRGNLIFAKNRNEVMFGFGGWANKLPIIDKSGQQNQYPRNYIPVPSRF